MDEMETLAQRNAMLIHSLDWNERRAGIFEPAPADEAAVATSLGLVLNCLSSGLYMVSHAQPHCWSTSPDTSYSMSSVYMHDCLS